MVTAFLFSTLLCGSFLPTARAEKTLTVGVYNNAPTIFSDTSDEPQGLFIDIIRDIAAKEGWELVFQTGDFQALLDLMKEGRLDLLPAVAYSRKREVFLDFTRETILSNWAELYTAPRITINSFLDLAGKTVAVKQGDIHFPALKKLVKRFNISCRFLETDEYLTNFEMLEAGYADVALVNRLFGHRTQADFSVGHPQIIFNPVEIRFAAPKGRNQDTLQTIDTYLLAYKKAKNSVYHNSVRQRFTAEPGDSQAPHWMTYSFYPATFLAILLLVTLLFCYYSLKEKSSQLKKTCHNLQAETDKRKKAETTLQHYQNIVESSSNAIALVGQDHRHILANNSYYQTIHFSGDSLQGELIQPLLGSDFFEQELREPAEKCLRGSVVTLKTRPRKKTLHGRQWLVTLTPYYSQENIIEAYIISINDNTAQLELESKLQKSQKLETIGLLAGGVAHDLNNILSGLVSYPDLLLINRDADDPMTAPLKIIKKSGERAAAIVQDLLTLARRGIDSKKTIHLNAIVRDFMMSPEYIDLTRHRPEITVSCILDPELNNNLGSSTHLTKLLMNLVTNAVEAIPAEGSLTIATGNKRLSTTLKAYEPIPPGDYATLTVADTGTGMSAEELEQIFEPFYTNKIPGRSGTGLGMAVVWGTIKDHDGFIDIITELGKGCTITVYLPMTDETIFETTPDDVEQLLGNRERILIVDDLDEQRNLAATILKTLNYIPDTAASGEKAIEKCKQTSYDLLVLDMVMQGGIDGFMTYNSILELNPGQKAIITSGYSENNRVRRTQHLGAGSYIKKPYTIDTLGKAVKRELQKNP